MDLQYAVKILHEQVPINDFAVARDAAQLLVNARVCRTVAIVESKAVFVLEGHVARNILDNQQWFLLQGEYARQIEQQSKPVALAA